MKRMIFIIGALLLIATLPSLGERTQTDYNWKKQLEGIKRNEVLKDKEYPLLVKYAYIEELKTVDDVKQLKEKLLSYTNNYLPVFSKGNSSVRLLTLKEILQTEGENTVAASVKSLTEYLNHVIRIGMHTVKLTWNLNAKTYESLCVVSNNGVVYDHIIMNLMIEK